MPEIATGTTWPSPEDSDRLCRYEEARHLLDGEHIDIEAAKRIRKKLYEANAQAGGYAADGIVAIIFNLPKLIATKFADLQVLRTPALQMEDDIELKSLTDNLKEGCPKFWSNIHNFLVWRRFYGDGVLLPSVDKDGAIEVKIADPFRWFPVEDPNDPLKFIAHQIAWIEDISMGNEKSKPFLRVDVISHNKIERKAFEVENNTSTGSAHTHDKDHRHHKPVRESFKVGKKVDLSLHWGDLEEVDTFELDGIACVHVPNGQRSAISPFGVGDYEDSGTLVDEINWRLSTWSDANDKVSHPPRIMPKDYVSVDDNTGRAELPSRYDSEFIQRSKSGGDNEFPKYMDFALSWETLMEGLEQAVTAFLIRQEMAPALLGYQSGKQKESGEAKALGMGTTEAATRRDLLCVAPAIDVVLTMLAKMSGLKGNVSSHWSVGLPKTKQEHIAELTGEQSLGAITKRQTVQRLNPQFTEKQVDEQLKLLAEERAEEAKEFEQSQPFTARTG